MHRNKAHCTGRWDDFVLHEGRRERLSRMVKPGVLDQVQGFVVKKGKTILAAKRAQVISEAKAHILYLRCVCVVLGRG